MKTTTRQWLARSAFVTLVAVAMLIAGPRNAAADVCNGEGQLGTCPPFNDQTCALACIQAGHPDGGDCVGTCCTCFLR